MAITNEDKAMLERLWIGVARRMDNEFQQVLEDVRGMCDSVNSLAARTPLGSGPAYTVLYMRLQDWRAHFIKYLQVASEHPLGTSPSYVETLRQVVSEIELAINSIQGKRGGNVPRSQAQTTARPASQTHQQIVRPVVAPTPAAQTFPEETDPLLAIAAMRKQEAEDIRKDHQDLMDKQTESMKRRAEAQRQHFWDIQELRDPRKKKGGR